MYTLAVKNAQLIQNFYYLQARGQQFHITGPMFQK